MDQISLDKKKWNPETSSDASAYDNDSEDQKKSFTTRLIDSFKRDPNASVTRGSISSSHRTSIRPGDERAPRGSVTSILQRSTTSYDVESANKALAESPLLRKLRARHLQMIAIGGSIGTGLFVGSGKALAYGGPASLLIAFSLIGMMMYCTVQALGEMAVLFPVAGSFAAYSTRFLDPSWGFAMGWNYALQWLVVLPLEIVAASITVDYWIHDQKMNAAWVSIFLVVIIIINFFGVKGYGEAEFVFSIVKVTAVIGYM